MDPKSITTKRFMISQLLLSLWRQPRNSIRKLSDVLPNQFNLKALLFLSLTYFSMLLILFWDFGFFHKYFNVVSYQSIFKISGVLILVFAALSVFLNFEALVFFYFIQFLGGKGGFLSTKLVVYYSSLATIPIGLFFILFILIGHVNVEAEKLGADYFWTIILQGMLALWVVIFFIYYLVILIKMLSEIHQIPSERVLAAVLAGIASFCILCPLLINIAMKVIS